MIRSVLFLKYLPERSLGIILIFHAVIAFFSLMQIGLLNGGLRVFSVDKYKNIQNDTNNNNSTIILLGTITVIFVSIIFNNYFNANLFIVVFSIITAGFALMNNWYKNILIAKKKLKLINKINLISTLLSILLSLLIFKFDYIGAIISIFSMHFIFVALFLFYEKDFRPKKIYINLKIIKTLLSFGFVPYLTGIAIIINNQIDRFAIVKILSLESLGNFFLATVFVRIFSLFPENLNSLFAPDAYNLYSEGKFKEVMKIFYNYFSLLIGYIFLSILLLYLFGERVVGILFPDKISQLNYLFIMVPGIVAMVLSKPLSFLFNVAFNLKVIFYSNILSLLIYVFLLFILFYNNYFILENVAYIKSMQGIVVFLFFFTAIFFNYKKISNLYYIKKFKSL